MVFWEVALDIDDIGHALAQAGDAVLLAAGDDDQAVRAGPFQRLGDPQFILTAVPAGEHERRVEAIAFGKRRCQEAGPFKRTEMRAKALDEMQRSVEPDRETKAGFGAEEDGPGSFSGWHNNGRLEWIKQRLHRFGRHVGSYPAG